MTGFTRSTDKKNTPPCFLRDKNGNLWVSCNADSIGSVFISDWGDYYRSAQDVQETHKQDPQLIEEMILAALERATSEATS